MSATVDERVVEMRFDNKQFESNVATSMSTLDKLKRSLKFDGASKGLEDINSAAKKVNMDGLGGAVESVKLKFSALDVAAVTALANITNSAVNAGKQLVKSLSVDQLSAGWQKFSDKTTSVATLVAQGNAIEDVNDQLDRLNWFTDETSYNFTEMVSNIAKFTATGKGLNESVTAMEGIATWAALSGQNAATASRAMYQLSQAMGAGVMRLEDYKSIQNASMDTEEFRQKCLDAGVALGTLKENGDGTYSSLVDGASGASFGISQFATNLTKEMWLTSDVMMKVFNDYSSAVEGIYNAAEEKGMLASEIIDEIYTTAEQKGISTDEAIKSLGYDFDSFALKAFEAAQKARTFNDAIDSVKDAVSTGWMKTFELIFGDAEKATELWTDLANTLYDVFAAGGETRNTILEFALNFQKPWDAITEKLKSVQGITDKVKNVTKAVGDAASKLEYFQDVVNKVWHGDFNNVGDNPDRFDLLTKAGYDPRVVQDLVNKGYQYKLTVEDIEAAHKKFGLTMKTTTKETKNTMVALDEASSSYARLSDEQLKQAGLTEDEISLYRALEKEADRLGISINDLAKEMSENDGRTLLIDSFKNIGNSILEVGDAIKKAWSEIFNVPSVGEIAVKLYGAIKSLNEFSKKLTLVDKDTGDFNETGKKIIRTFKGIFAVVDMVSTVLGGGFKIALKLVSSILSYFDLNILDVTATIGDAIVAFDEWFNSIFDISGVLDAIVPAVETVIETIKGWIKAFKELPWVSKIIEKFDKNFGGLGDTIKVVDEKTGEVVEHIKTLGDLPGVQKALNWLAEAFSKISEVVNSAITVIKDWFTVFKETEGVQQLITAVTDLASAFGNLINGDIDVNEFAKQLGSSLADLLTSLPKIAVQLGKDFIAGFGNGLGDGISDVIQDVLDFCGNFISAFATALGIHSPSVIAHQNGVDWCQGFINGLSEMLQPVINALQPIIEAVKMVFSSFWKYITDENGDLEWDKILVGGMAIESLVILKSFADSFEKVANALTSFSDIFSNVSKVLKSFSKVLDSVAFDFKAKAILKLAISIGILVAAIWVLAQIDDIGKLWNAVGVIVVLAGVLIGLAWAMKQFSAASIEVNKEGANIKGVQSALLQIGLAILLVAAAVKLIGNMDAKEAEQGFKGLAGIAVGMVVFLAAIGGISRYSKDVAGIGKMMAKLSLAMILMAVACKLIGRLSADEIGKGILFAAAFSVFIIAITAVAKGAGEHVGKVGGMALKLSIAMVLLVGVCKLVGMLSVSEMVKGAAFAGAFVLFVWALVAVTQISSDKQLAKVSGLVLSVSFSLLLIAGVCKIISQIPTKDLVKGAIVIAGFMLLLKMMVGFLTIGNEQQIAKVSASILAMSTAIAIMAGVAVVLGMVDTADLAKGIVAVGILAAMMTLMVHSLKGAQNVKGAIIVMAATIAILAGCIVALSLINDTESIKTATACMILVMGMYTLMINSLKGLQKGKISVGSLIALTGVIAILAGIITLLSIGIKDSTSAIAGTASLVALMLALAVVLKILNGIEVDTKNALKGVLALTAMALPLLAFVGVLAIMSNVENAAANVKSLVILATAMTVLLGVLTLIGALVMGTGGVGAIAIVAGISALTAMAIPLLAFVGVLKLMSGIENATTNIMLLITFMTIMTDLLVRISLVAPLAIMGVAAMDGLVLLMGAIGVMAVAVGALMEKFPSIQKFLDTGLPVLEQLAGSIGTMVGNFIGGIGEGLSDSLVKMGENISELMGKLAEASDKASGVKGESFDGVKQLMAVMLEIGGTTVGTSIADIFTLGGTSMEKFEKDGTAFFNAMKAIGEAASNVSINEENMDAIIGVAEKLVALQSSLEPIGGVITWFTGRDDLGTFGINAAAFVYSMKLAFASISDSEFNTEAMNTIISAATSLAELQSHLEPIGGVVTWFTGRDDLGTFGINVAAFVYSMKLAFSSLDDTKFNVAAINTIIATAVALATLQSHLEPIGGVVTWFAGRDDLGTFGINVAVFIESMKLAFSSLDDVTFNVAAINTIIATAAALATLQSHLEPIGGVVTWFAGRDDLGTFGINVAVFIESMKLAFSSLDDVTFNVAAINTIIATAVALATLQSHLEPIGGVITWFTGRDDLGTFGINVAAFIYSMKLAFGSLDDVTFNVAAINVIIATAAALATLQSHLEPIGGVISWFTGRDDLGTFGINIATFIGSMKTALETLDGATLDEAALTSVITAATKLAELQSTLEPMGGVVSWFTGRSDLGTFGTNIGLFADAMGRLKTGMGEDGITEATITSITNTGTALIELQKALPEEHWFDGKMNLSDFAKRIDDFATAMGTFGSKASEIDSAAVSTVITTAYRIKTLIESLVDLDTSGLQTFTGIGTGGFGADGAAYEIAQAIAAFSKKVADINTEAVSVAVTAAQKLKSLIASLANLDASGIENFKPGEIGRQIKIYSDKVAEIDTGVVASSITSATRLKNFIASLANLDTSGIGNFKVGSIGASLKAYSASISGIDVGAVSASITAANRVKNFISSLAGLNTSGAGSFKSAIDELSTVSISKLVKAFSGASAQLNSAGASMISGLVKGMQSKLPAAKSAIALILSSMANAVKSKSSTFKNAGETIMIRLGSGISGKSTSVVSALTSCLTKASSSIRGHYNSFYSAGSYLAAGFANGISDNAYKAAAKAKAMAEAAVKAAREALKINSPSKVFKKIGSGVPEGFAIGISMLSGDVSDAVTDMTSSAINTTRSAMSTVLDALSCDMDTQPTIRPIVDLSDVQTGADAIDGLFNSARTVGVRSNLSAVGSTMNAIRQNGRNDDVVLAINKLRDKLDGVGNTYNTVNGVTYDDGSNVTDAVETLVRYAKIGRRV